MGGDSAARARGGAEEGRGGEETRGGQRGAPQREGGEAEAREDGEARQRAVRRAPAEDAEEDARGVRLRSSSSAGTKGPIRISELLRQRVRQESSSCELYLSLLCSRLFAALEACFSCDRLLCMRWHLDGS